MGIDITALLAGFTSLWPLLLGLIVAGGSVFVGWSKSQAAKVATADKKTAEADAATATANQRQAEERAKNAEAAAQAIVDAQQELQAAHDDQQATIQAIAALPDDKVIGELRAQFQRD